MCTEPIEMNHQLKKSEITRWGFETRVVPIPSPKVIAPNTTSKTQGIFNSDDKWRKINPIPPTKQSRMIQVMICDHRGKFLFSSEILAAQVPIKRLKGTKRGRM